MSKIHGMLLLAGGMALAAVIALDRGAGSLPDPPLFAPQPTAAEASQAGDAAPAARRGQTSRTQQDAASGRRGRGQGGRSRERQAEFARRNRLPLSAHARKSEVPPPAAPSLAGRDPLSRELRAIYGMADPAGRLLALERLLLRLRDPLQFGRAALLLGSLDQRRAYELLDGLVRRETDAERLAAALDALGRVAPTGALTSASELLNSDASAAVKIKAAQYMVALVEQKPYLAYPAVSTLKYARESETDATVSSTMQHSESQIREASATRGRDLPR